jgi:type I restriction enzyme, S subunit
MKNYAIRPRDILISLVGTQGKISIVPDTIEQGIINPRLLKITFDDSKALPEFMKILLGSKFTGKQIQKFSQGLTMGILNTEIIKQILFLLPPISEQQKITFILSKVDELIQKTDQVIEQTQRLKKGLIQRLLTSGIGHTKFKKVKSFFGKYDQLPEGWRVVKLGDVENSLRIVATP